ncbi:MAG: phosphoribosyltransferase [Thermoprotei archaeon]|mgnify:CR=1 FL=1|nr:MAG: phosphoribosyltransferase [Thermoprotei archaeon]
MGIPKLKFITWNSLFRDILDLCKIIIDEGYPADTIVAISRGGLVVSRIVSDIMNISDIMIVAVKAYENIARPRKEVVIVSGLNGDIKGRRVLLVDDIVDTGSTLEVTLRYLEEQNPLVIKSAAPYVKPWASIKPDYYVKEVKEWIVFPYEVGETLRSLERLFSRSGSIDQLLTSLGLEKEVVEYFKKLTSISPFRE